MIDELLLNNSFELMHATNSICGIEYMQINEHR